MAEPVIDKLQVASHSPDKLLRTFSHTRPLHWLAVAIALHLVILLLTSIGYLRDRLDPEGAEARRQAQTQAAAPVAQAAKPTATAAPASAEPSAAATPKPDTTDTEAMIEANQEAPIIKEITDLPAPGEIPREPADLGISIDETN